MLRINRFNENEFDLEEIKNIFTSLTDEGFSISERTHSFRPNKIKSPINYLTIWLSGENSNYYFPHRQSNMHFGQGEENVVNDTFDIIKNTAELYESCYEISERLKDIYEIVYFKIYPSPGLMDPNTFEVRNEKIIITFRIKHKV